MKCPKCGSTSEFNIGLSGEGMSCGSCHYRGGLEEFGLVTHCQCRGIEEKAEAEVTVVEALRRVERGEAGVKEAAALRAALDWEQECGRAAEAEGAEARYWARKLYREAVSADMLLYLPAPEWVKFIEKRQARGQEA